MKPEVGPSIGLECQDDLCSPQLELGDIVNLTCTSGEARPAIELIWTNDHGTPLTPIYEDLGEGSLTGTFVTVSTIQYTFKRATILTCQADGESIGKGSAEQRKTIALTLSTTAGKRILSNFSQLGFKVLTGPSQCRMKLLSGDDVNGSPFLSSVSKDKWREKETYERSSI